MRVELVAVSGPHSGQSFEIADGYQVGRLQCQILLDDPGVSTLHAKVVLQDGKYLLKDLESKNGLLVDKQRVSEVLLVPGLIIQIGSGLFEVRTAESDLPPVPEMPTRVMPLPVVENTFAGPPPIHKMPAPGDYLGFLRETLEKVENKPRVLIPVFPRLQLTFIGGLQTETVWTIGYGPRTCGTASLDLTLFELQGPDICFEIVPTPRGLALKTANKDVVRVNGNSNPLHFLKKGDIITVLTSKIEVDFVEQ